MPLVVGETAVLEGPEAHHLLHVMRAKTSDELTLFDGQGMEFAATIVRLTRHAVHCDVTQSQSIDRERPWTLELAVALPRGDRQEWLVQKAVELGVTRLIPWETERSVAEPRAKVLERLQRTVIEACKQCGRNRLMTIAPSTAFTDVVTAPSTGARWLAHPAPEATTVAQAWPPAGWETQRSWQCGIGPEGGWTEAEVQLARDHGWQIIDLGSRILRTETAAVALASIAMLLDA